MAKKIDPILASVFQRRFKSITEEMGLTLLRTTRSPILNEARDFVTGLYTPEGRMLEQTEYIPVLAFAIQPACQYIVEYFGDDIHPGDVILHNDVFTGGNQNADVAVFNPFFMRMCWWHGLCAKVIRPTLEVPWQAATTQRPVRSGRRPFG